MKGKLILLALALTTSAAFAQSNSVADRVIYKWIDGGLVYYSHILPQGVEDYTKLDSRGIEIIDYSDEFNEVVEMAVRPKTLENSTEQKEEPKTNAADDVKKRNCEIAQNNMRLLDRGDVYDKDADGNVIALDKAQVETKRKNTQEDINYYCNQ